MLTRPGGRQGISVVQTIFPHHFQQTAQNHHAIQRYETSILEKASLVSTKIKR
jgi:hypothetical protein